MATWYIRSLVTFRSRRMTIGEGSAAGDASCIRLTGPWAARASFVTTVEKGSFHLHKYAVLASDCVGRSVE